MQLAPPMVMTLVCFVACGGKTAAIAPSADIDGGPVAPETDAGIPDTPTACPLPDQDDTDCSFCDGQWYCSPQMPEPNCPPDVANGSSLDQPCSGVSCIACQNPDDFHVNNIAWIWACGNGPAAGTWQGMAVLVGGGFATCTPP
jgi:hypothetical protein